MIISRTEPIQSISTQCGRPQALSIRKNIHFEWCMEAMWCAFFIMPHVMCASVLYMYRYGGRRYFNFRSLAHSFNGSFFSSFMHFFRSCVFFSYLCFRSSDSLVIFPLGIKPVIPWFFSLLSFVGPNWLLVQLFSLLAPCTYRFQANLSHFFA